MLAGTLWARSRNRAPLWGVLGILSIVGMLGLALLHRRCPDCGTAADAEALRCPQCLRRI